MSNIINYCNTNSGFVSALLCLLTIIFTIIIGIFQICQNCKMSKYQKQNDKKSSDFQNEVEERNKDFQERIENIESEIKELNKENIVLQENIHNRDEKRHSDNIEALAYSFIHDNIEDIGFLPFCLIACMYDRGYSYRRAIYNKFCSLSEEVQNKILELRGINIERSKEDDFYDVCYKAWMNCIKVEKLDNLEECYYSLYSDNGKYIHDTLLDFGNKKKKDFSKERKEINNVLGEFFRNKKENIKTNRQYPIRPLAKSVGFNRTGNISKDMHSCLVATEIARYSAMFSNDKHPDFYVPVVSEVYTGIYMEDVFLATLFEIYFKLVLEDKKE